jgi:hypothetical protein
MPFPLKIKKIHFLSLFFAIVGVLFVLRLIFPEWAIIHGQQVEHQLMAQTEGDSIVTNDVLPESFETSTEEVGDGITRKLVVIKKVKSSPSKYPRGKNLPRVKPL